MAIKCKDHPFDQIIGVCASCLRERLLVLAAAQSARRLSGEANREEQIIPPIVFPRSVSPYIANRRSVDLEAQLHRQDNLRFFSTPQAGPALARNKGSSSGFFTSIFNRESRSRISGENQGSSKASGGSMSWFSALIPGRRKKMKQQGEDFWATPARKPPQSSAAGLAVSPSPLLRPSARRNSGTEGDSSGTGGGGFPGHHRRRRTVGGDVAALGHNPSRKTAEIGSPNVERERET